jgi:hypothetical protein
MCRTRRWSGNTAELLSRQRKKQTAYRRKFLGTNLGSLRTILWDEPSVVQVAHQYFTPEKKGGLSNISIRPFWSFIGAFAKFRKATVSFVMSVSPSIRPHGTTWLPLDGFSWNLIFVFSRKSVEKTQVSLKSGTLHPDQYTFLVIYRSVLLRMKNVSGKSCRETRNTHFMFNNFFIWKIVPFMKWSGKMLWGEQTTNDNMAHAHCVLDA